MNSIKHKIKITPDINIWCNLLYIKPTLGKYKIKALSSPVLQQFINNMAKQNFSRNTLSVVKNILSKSFKYAVLQEMIRYSPMGNVSLPSPRNEKLKPRTAPHVYIPPEKITAIFERFRREPPPTFP